MPKNEGKPNSGNESQPEESYADKMIREMRGRNQKEQEALSKHEEEIKSEHERLKEILKTRPLTDEERERFDKLTN
jgi:hypothetical protein